MSLQQPSSKIVLNALKDAVATGFLITILYLVGRAIYNVFFHPLSRFPGPISFAVSRIPYCYRLINGTLPFDMLGLHQKYGDIVRIAPDELAISHPDAWKDIMGNRKSGEEMGKAMYFYRPIEDDPTHIVNEEREEHSRLRRQLSHGFSEKSMRDQEPLIAQYIDLLIQRLHENCAGGAKPLNLTAWYNYTTFDIIGDLAFGEPFGCLKNSEYHSWIRMIFDSGRLGTILQSLAFYPRLKRFLLKMAPKSAKEHREQHMRLTKAKLLRRIEGDKERPDLIEGLLKKKDEWNMSLEKLIANSEILIIGGSETTATLLSGVTYYLLTNPDKLQKLTAEVRSAFKSEDEINIVSVNKLTYMLACLDEGLRMYPPIANGLPRVVPKGGANIIGTYVPENTIVAIHQWALYRREEYFTDPNHYHPERWLGDSRFANDKREALQPFHVGPRNCLGRNLAYTEMRLILARVIYNFDLRIAEDSLDWVQKQRNFLMWEKGPLNVYLTPVTKGSA
ncbi:hypothetical protein VTN96DRAFT_3888 [Rasamsonia emersonii]|uniref:Cytochrome P450 monooxygenase n=1 Tax=Rasamsonia emersonii (strain ATCC 16479 / CBS 393.64 / IMI 116815) TaxID=1408163 RepID=A0A0F4YM93_RASE3|nr:Uncharacterized protein T310_7308 [Rasamsonia emersonii CBS 393.64]KKA18733.1 Uncharacterized protein T310_7308 [Rasamsonia emersonii CBS 393.64]